ncbi:L,D-transpeptidase catalytic domain [Limimonas halophila]|uniref:L,D-transpeptidase catalytic domain n=1 Tax=Limimonas halophila TaxID=1082479 RepID=A0A1G7SNI6_9PROT|nr:L,D-transpeptidase family protein [Limimonas halophila]SDG24667.1 L,D-transpeptidase catalytic domain [Limimonas halophila]
MDLTVFPTADGWRARLDDGRVWPCVIGRSGTTATKAEGDGATPLGAWPVRRVLYRPDRLSEPETSLPLSAIAPDDGWCDDPANPHYNRPVKLPFDGGHEVLWRDDGLYDLVVVLGHNDDPPTPGAGSAIFLHRMRPDGAPTEGCVALEPAALAAVVRALRPGSRIVIQS